jgi:hypothetical protein
MTLVVAHPDVDVISNATAYSYYFRTRQQIKAILWIIVLRSRRLTETGEEGLTYQCNIRVGSGDIYSIGVSGESHKVVKIIETRSQTSTPYYQYISITKTGGDSDMYVDQIAAYQIRRYALDPEAETNEYAADITSCKSGAIIMDRSRYSVDGVITGLINARTNCRRASLFNWYAPDGNGIYVGQTSGWQSLFHVKPEALSRYIYDGITTRLIQITVLAAQGNDGAGNAQIKATADSGDSIIIAVEGSTPSTYSVTLYVSTESLSDAKGRRGAVADRINFEVYGNGNAEYGETFALKLFGIDVGEID